MDKSLDDNMDEDSANHLILADTVEHVDVFVGISQWQTADGRYILEEDYRVAGEVWRVHKSDADPYPSSPHAHCVGGAKRFVGRTLHLGTAELFNKRTGTGRYLERNQFERLLELIRPKFPDLTFPLPT
jgi:hypothetical protein